MSVSFLEPARVELEEAVAYYENQRAGLGEEFAQEVESTLRRIENFPLAWTTLSPHARRCRLDRFPYGIVYQVRGEDILIVAVMHLRRKPGYWQNRLPES